MNYRRLGRSGLKVSELSLGSWVTYGNQLDTGAARECMAAAWDRGVNFFDNAEVYAAGKSEEIMGEALKKLAWPRLKYIVSTKFFWGITEGPNEKSTLNRKYLMNAIDGSLKRLQLDYVDLVYCHRADPSTPMEETVWAMHDMIDRGKALYWGTSEWSAAQIAEAWQVADRHHLRKPVMEQPEYNLFHRSRVEREYAELQRQHRLLSQVAGWYLGPSFLAGGIFGATVLGQAPAPVAAKWLVAALMLAVFALTGWAIVAVNRRAVRRVLEPRLRELEAMRAQWTERPGESS